MRYSAYTWLLMFASLALLSSARARSGEPSSDSGQAGHAFTFQDVGEQAGLLPAAAGSMGHAAGWGDVDGDGWVDLYIGTFHQGESQPSLFFRNSAGQFRLDDQEALRISTRASAALLADLDNDGDLDLYVSSMPRAERGLAPCTLFQNDGTGKFTNISQGNGACPSEFGGRSATVLDYDGDGLLDLLVGEDPLPGYNGSPTRSSRLFRNAGQLQFSDVSQAAGLPEGIPGLGVAAGDVNNDGWPDFFLAAQDGGNRLFLNDGHGQFHEAPGCREVFAWESSGGDNMVCGVCFGDINRDGWADVVLGQHYDSPWQSPVSIRLYLNRGVRGAGPVFEDVTEAAGLKPLPMKAPHVEIQDFDNDGWPDIYASLVKFADGRPHPLIYKNLGPRDGLPAFREDVLAVNDFPNQQDLDIQRKKDFFAKMVQDKKVMYMAAAPSADYDNDGRLDLFLANWWPDSPSLLLHNESPGGHWLQVQVRGAHGVNRMGIGARVEVYPAGKLEEPAARIAWREIAAGYGYASCQPAIAHFGLGTEERVDVQVILPHGKGAIIRKDVPANQRIVFLTDHE